MLNILNSNMTRTNIDNISSCNLTWLWKMDENGTCLDIFGSFTFKTCDLP